MAFRLIRYAVAAMQRHLEAGHKKLPLVIPVLFYTGRRSAAQWMCWQSHNIHATQVHQVS